MAARLTHTAPLSSEPHELASLLVSVRSPTEARAALAGGASIIDVKDPSRGSLGRCDPSVWQAVRVAVPQSVPVSVALGELTEWTDSERPQIPAAAWAGINFCKLGLAHAPPGWAQRWAQLRDELRCTAPLFPAWVAVVYLDWKAARAPHPDAVIEAATAVPDCRAVLFDTWSKSTGTRLDESWKPRVERSPRPRTDGSTRRVARGRRNRPILHLAARNLRRQGCSLYSRRPAGANRSG